MNPGKRRQEITQTPHSVVVAWCAIDLLKGRRGPAPSPPWPPPRRRRGPRPVADGSRRSSTRQPRWLCDDRVTLLEENFKNSKNNFCDDHSVTTTRWLYYDLVTTTRLRRPSSYDDHPTEKKLKKFFLRRPSYDDHLVTTTWLRRPSYDDHLVTTTTLLKKI